MNVSRASSLGEAWTDPIDKAKEPRNEDGRRRMTAPEQAIDTS